MGRIDYWLWPWAKWADKHGVPEMFWGLADFWYANKSPRHLWARFREHWFDPQQECIDYIDGMCVGYFDTPSRVMAVWHGLVERVVPVWFWEWVDRDR